MNTPLISIIIPVYKAEKYLHCCVDSVLAQSFTNFELILIDDGSPDNSGTICDEYAKQDRRIKVFHQENQGVSAARNLGIEQAKGEWIAFIDSDDWVENTMYEEMYHAASLANADIAGCNFWEILPTHASVINTFYTSQSLFLADIISSNWGVVWKLLIKKYLFTDYKIRFPQNLNGGEDYLVCVQLLVKAKQTICINKPLYHYNRCNGQSIITTSTLTNTYDQIKATDLVIYFLQKEGLLEKFSSEIKIRQFHAKLPLLTQNPKEWKKLYPQSNFLYKELLNSPKSKLFAFLLLHCDSSLINFFYKRLTKPKAI